MDDKNKKIKQADTTHARKEKLKSATEYESDWELVKQTEGLDDLDDSGKRKDASAREDESSKEGKRMAECGCKYF